MLIAITSKVQIWQGYIILYYVFNKGLNIILRIRYNSTIIISAVSQYRNLFVLNGPKKKVVILTVSYTFPTKTPRFHVWITSSVWVMAVSQAFWTNFLSSFPVESLLLCCAVRYRAVNSSRGCFLQLFTSRSGVNVSHVVQLDGFTAFLEN